MRIQLAPSYPCFAHTDPRAALKQHMSTRVVSAVSRVLEPSFSLSNLLRECFCMTRHFSFSLPNTLIIIGMRIICGLEEIAPFCSRRRGCTNYSSMQIKQLNAVIQPYFHSSTFEKYVNLLPCAPHCTAIIII